MAILMEVTELDWVFSGIGTLLVGLIIGAGGGSFVGYRIAVTKHTQSQKAGDNSRQFMTGRDNATGRDDRR